MKSKAFPRPVFNIAVLVLAVGTGAMAQTPNHMKFRGTIDDFTPATTPATVTGPWKVQGHWSLTVKEGSDMACFSAALTMVRSDLGVTQTGGGDLNNPMDRMAHTHHITLVDCKVAPIANGFEVTGAVTITANGNSPPPFGPTSTLTIDITGGNHVAFSNITLLFGEDAAGHFGSNSLHGVVRSSK